MIEPKVSLTLFVPGAGMVSSQVCEENPKKNYDTTTMKVEYEKESLNQKHKLVKKRVKETLVIHTRKSNTARHHINISKDAYNYMIKEGIMPNIKSKVWNSMSKTQRLKAHFDVIAENFNASGYSYEVLDD